jgi:hypothetical protein
MISVSYLFEELSDQEIDEDIKRFMGKIGESLKKNHEQNSELDNKQNLDAEKLKDKIFKDRLQDMLEQGKKPVWLLKNRGVSI